MVFILKSFDHLANFLALIAIVIAILSINFVSVEFPNSTEGNDNKAKRRINWPVLVFAMLLGLTATVWAIIVVRYNNQYTIVPNLYGLTYDDAVAALYRDDLEGRLLLASTNRDLSNSDSRVVWQSIEKGTGVLRAARVSFVLDDCFALEYIPLNINTYYSSMTDRSDVLPYKIEFRDALWQSMNNTENEPGETTESQGHEESHWYIEIDPNEAWDNFETRTIQGRAMIVTENSYSYYTYANSMAITLQKIADETARTIGYKALQYNNTDYMLIGKLIPSNMTQAEKQIETHLEEDRGVLFLPLILKSGDYKFFMSFLTEDGLSREWYHDIRIRVNE